ncbi:hypothetical protein D3C76_1465260 [compost metagenome]
MHPFREKSRIIVWRFGTFPHIEGFRHNQHTHLIRKFHELFGRHIMRGADGVNAHFFEQNESSTQCRQVKCRSQRPKIVVFTHAVQLHLDSVQVEPFIGIQLDIPESNAL